MARRVLHIDLETYSETDIKKVGTYKYAENSEIILCAYAYDDEPVQITEEPLPGDFIAALSDPAILKTAYNAVFEIRVLSHYLKRELDVSQWRCTMAATLRLGLPAGLKRVGEILQISRQKLDTGETLIKFFSQPARQNGLFGNRHLPGESPDKWEQFKEYCKRDVEAEREIYKELGKYEVSANEELIWQLDYKINSAGVKIDTELVTGAIAIAEQIRNEAYTKAYELTGGVNLNSNAQLTAWIEEVEGRRPNTLDKSAREELKTQVTAEVQQVLELKDLVSKSSVKKYQAMLDTLCADGRVRGMFQYYGANRAGRWTSKVIQLQNLPQNHIKYLDLAREYVKARNIDALEIGYRKPVEVLSQLLRTAIVAEEGRFIVADFSAIEARIIAWLADEQWRMEVFAQGGDIYCASASEMFGVPVEKHGINAELRQKGKIAELACGYGGGVNALKAFGADKMGLSEEEMQGIIDKWRTSSPNIVQLWQKVERFARRSITNKSKLHVFKKLEFIGSDEYLFIGLPSGRKLAYRKAAIDKGITYEGGVKWERVSTWGGKLVENIVQAIARDCLAVAMYRLDRAGYKIVMHVHDEIICEMTDGSLEEVIAIMCEPLNWAPGLLLNADGYETVYYKKD